MSDAISRFDAQKLVYDYCHARTVEGRQLKSPAVFTTHTGTDLAEAIGTLPAVSAKHDFAQPEPRPKPFDCQCGAVGPCEASFCFAPQHIE